MTTVVPARTSRPDRTVRTVAGVLLAAHGLIHLMGVALLWRLGEPGTLRYDQVRPAPGSAAGVAVGAGWLASAVLFVVLAVVLVRGGAHWRPLAVGAAVLSAAVLAPSAGVAPAGLVVDGAVLLAAVLAGSLHRRPGRREGHRG